MRHLPPRPHLKQGAGLSRVAAQHAQRGIQHSLPPKPQRWQVLRLQVQGSVKLVGCQPKQATTLGNVAWQKVRGREGWACKQSAGQTQCPEAYRRNTLHRHTR
jgi:hypothetical protein